MIIILCIHLLFFLQDDHKLNRAFIAEIFDDITLLMDPLTEIINKTMKDFTPMLDFIDELKPFLKTSKKYLDEYSETEAAEIKDYEEKLSGVMERIIQLENLKDEL